ncbi:MAG TPA: glycosyltransferase [bacterium]|nr:glycosyltransferase [bacterium]HNS49303.1 glycosyltransferase [bacterium]
MKKVLIITYHFPPARNVGSLRPAGLARHLPEFGWEPVVLTSFRPGPPAAGLQVLETWPAPGERIDRSGLIRLPAAARPSYSRRLAAGLTGLVAFPDNKAGWSLYAADAARPWLADASVSALISTSSPATCHLAAAALKREFPRVRWVADFRDLWTQNHYYARPRLVRRLEAKLEARTLSRADCLTTVSGPLAERLAGRYSNPVAVIENGFNPAELAPAGGLLDEKFTITYTGSLYGARRDPSLLLEVLAGLAASGRIEAGRVEVNFYGRPEMSLASAAGRLGLSGLVRQHGPVPRREAVARQRSSQVLLLLNWDDPAETGVYTAKLFEYLAAGRPVLALGGSGGVVRDLLERTGAGFHCADRAALEARLLDWYGQWRGSGRVGYGGRREEILKYSQREMAAKFAAVLEGKAG